MANHKSAEKRARGSIRKGTRNTTYMSKVRTAIKTLRTALSDGLAAEEISNLFKTAQSTLAKAATKGIVKKNTASRNTSRLSAAIKKAADPATAKAPTKKSRTKAVKKKTTAKKTSKAKKSTAKK